jgi:membrane protein DedA with SNARE-associated domain
MDHISISIIRHFVEIHAIAIYLIIFLGVVIEGEIVVIFAGIFSFLGSINIFLAIIAVVLGGATKSFIGYTIGYYLQKHHSHKPFINKIERRIEYFLPRFKDRPFWSIFTSRFLILGIGWFTVLFSGYKKIPLKIYIKAEGYSLAIWSVGVMTLGYFFGYTALAISRDVRHVLLIILIFFIMFFVLEKVIAFIFELFNIKEFNEYE